MDPEEKRKLGDTDRNRVDKESERDAYEDYLRDVGERRFGD